MRPDPDFCNGLMTEIVAWFVRCAGVPGPRIEPRDESFFGNGNAFSDFAHVVISAAYRTPYSDIGDYMRRWWYMPEIFGERARVHLVRRSDCERVVHDHPWHFVSVILEEGYTEEVEYEPSDMRMRKRYRAGDVLFRHAEHRHRLELEHGVGSWSLVFTSPKVRNWGFWTPDGFVPHQAYGGAAPRESIGSTS